MTLRLNGSSSGYTEIDAPAVAGSNTLVLPGGNGTAGQALTTNGSGTLSWTTQPLTTYFESAAQTITAAGTFTVAHGLGKSPVLIVAVLKCVTAEGNYSIGDEVVFSHIIPSESANSMGGVSFTYDSTNIIARYGSRANTFYIPNKTTGALVNLTNANWNLIVRALA